MPASKNRFIETGFLKQSPPNIVYFRRRSSYRTRLYKSIFRGRHTIWPDSKNTGPTYLAHIDLLLSSYIFNNLGFLTTPLSPVPPATPSNGAQGDYRAPQPEHQESSVLSCFLPMAGAPLPSFLVRSFPSSLEPLPAVALPMAATLPQWALCMLLVVEATRTPAARLRALPAVKVARALGRNGRGSFSDTGRIRRAAPLLHPASSGVAALPHPMSNGGGVPLQHCGLVRRGAPLVFISLIRWWESGSGDGSQIQRWEAGSSDGTTVSQQAPTWS